MGGRDKRWVNYQLSPGWWQDRGQGLNQLRSRDRPTPDKHPAATHTAPRLVPAPTMETRPAAAAGALLSVVGGGPPTSLSWGCAWTGVPAPSGLEPEEGSPFSPTGKCHPETLKASIGCQAAGCIGGLAARLLGGML